MPTKDWYVLSLGLTLKLGGPNKRSAEERINDDSNRRFDTLHAICTVKSQMSDRSLRKTALKYGRRVPRTKDEFQFNNKAQFNRALRGILNEMEDLSEARTFNGKIQKRPVHTTRGSF